MSSVLAALKGSFGDNDYYMLRMKAEDLANKAKIPAEMPEWKEMTLEERWQRQISYNRVKTQIAPYLARDKSRFFGAIIAAVTDLDSSNFEPVGEIAKKGMPNLYASEAEAMGFLTLKGHEMLYPLDGQHRIKALQFAIGGVDQKGNKIQGFEANTSIANDDVVVILIPYNEERARRIFTKVNRYAKATTTGQNLVVDDDDIVAVTARLVANEVIGENLVNYNSNTLSAKSPQFTTLAIVAECNVAILESCFPEKIVRTEPVKGDRERLYKKQVLEVWRFLVGNIDLFRDALEDKKGVRGDDKRIEIRGDYLLGKPVPQWCLVKAFMQLIAQPVNPLTKEEAARRLNAISWERGNPIWNGLLLEGARDRILTKNRAIAARVIAYMAGENIGEIGEAKLRNDYLDLFPTEDQQDKELPGRIV